MTTIDTGTDTPSEVWNHETIFPVDPAHTGRSIVAGLLLVLVLVLYGLFLHTFYQPANPGVDQNGYMVTARLLSEHGRIYFTPHNPLQFAGRMMIQTPKGQIYAKYPPGVGLLGAILRLIHGPTAMYLVDPICTVMALFFAYLLFRSMLDPFMAILGVIWLGLNPVTLAYADDANSHGAALGFTVLGFWALFSWWRNGGAWRGIIAGLALGFCCYMRYTELLWCLPLMAVVLLAVQSHRRPLKQGILMLVMFAVPVIIFALLNWVSFGAPWRTGYWFCKEQTGFAWQYFIGDSLRQGNWQTLLEQMENIGMFLLFPLAIAGLIRLFWTSRRLALVVALWAVPSAVVYMFYYWAPTNDFTTAYLRFFLDIIPALIMVALWLLARGAGNNYAARAIMAGVLTLVGVGYSAYIMAPQMLTAENQKLQLLAARQVLQIQLKPGSVVFADERMCDYLNSIGGYRLYSASIFAPTAFNQFDRVTDHTGPIGFQKARAELYSRLLGEKTADGQWQSKSLAQLHAIELGIMRDAWKKHKQVAFFIPADQEWPLVPHEPGVQIRQVAVLDPSWGYFGVPRGHAFGFAHGKQHRPLQQNTSHRDQRTLLILSPEKHVHSGATAFINNMAH